ncbi:MAG: DUF3267 domain-containing protein [Candidatus Izemoplasmatales bacterium]|nr:DUF3267 domain-containing protein [bacterium]MDZ4196652.1 DUF3267 domain-containing protein [Candidatus Izemoplasmatales bacterium]
MNKQSVEVLPSHYHLVESIDFKENRAQFILLNVLSILFLLPFIIPVVYGWIHIPTSREELLSGLLISLGIFIVLVFVHEAIHGFVYSQGTNKKVKYQFHGFAASASVPGVYFYKKHYLKVGLAPALIINPILLLLVVLTNNQWQFILYLTLVFHFNGCVGDFYVTWLMRKRPDTLLTEDYGIGMRMYAPNPKAIVSGVAPQEETTIFDQFQ